MFTALSVRDACTTRRTLLSWAGGACVLLAAMAGCRTARDNQVDLMERELRTQEDYIYELEDYVVEYSEKLRQCRCSQPMTVVSKSSQPKSVLKKPKAAKADVGRSQPLRLDEEPLFEPGEEMPDQRPRGRRTSPRETQPPLTPTDETFPEDLDVPGLDIGEPVSRTQSDSRVQAAAYNEPAYSDPAYSDPAYSDPAYSDNDALVATDDELLMIPQPLADDGSVLPPIDAEPLLEDDLVEMAEHRAPTRGRALRTPERAVVTHLFRNQPGDESPSSLLAVVEALDANDEPVEVDGEVSLMVMTADAKKPFRLKRWDFVPEDAAAAWQSSHLGDGLHLELPLGETELPAAPLELWVRIVNADGSKLLTQLPFERQLLAALEVETGARELAPARGKIAQQQSQRSARQSEGRLLTAEEPVPDEGASGWKPSHEHSDLVAGGSASTTANPSGWTAQPPGGRFPDLAPVVEQPAVGRQPVWTAGRVDTTPLGTSRRGSQPEWSPFR